MLERSFMYLEHIWKGCCLGWELGHAQVNPKIELFHCYLWLFYLWLFLLLYCCLPGWMVTFFFFFLNFFFFSSSSVEENLASWQQKVEMTFEKSSFSLIDGQPWCVKFFFFCSCAHFWKLLLSSSKYLDVRSATSKIFGTKCTLQISEKTSKQTKPQKAH